MASYVLLDEGVTSAAALYPVMDFSLFRMGMDKGLPHQLCGKQALPSFQVRT